MNRNDRAITALVMLGHAAVHTYEMTIPLFVVIWLVEFEVISAGLWQFDVSPWTIGIIVTVGYGLFGVGALPGGLLVDRFGSRRLIAGCLLGMGLSYILLGLAPSMLVIGFALVVWGIAASVYHPAGLSLISTGITARGTGLAYHGMAGNIGIGIGPLFAAILLLFVDWRTVALLLAIPALLAALYASQADFDELAAVDSAVADGGQLGDDSTPGTFVSRSRRVFAGGFVLVFVIVMCSGLYYRGILTFLPELIRGLPGFEPIPATTLLPAGVVDFMGIGEADGRMIRPQDYFYSGLLLIGIVGQYIGGTVSDRFPVEYGLVGGYLALTVLALLFVPVADMGVGPMIALGALLGVALFVVQPLYQAAVAEYSATGTRGLSYGYTYLGVFGVGALGGAVAGAILTFATVTVLFVTLACFAGLAAAFGLYLASGRLR